MIAVARRRNGLSNVLTPGRETRFDVRLDLSRRRLSRAISDMGMQAVTSTVESVRTACARARQFLEAHHLCPEATIEDYPIGRRERGKCRLQVERARGKGYRTVRTTTDRLGR